MALKESALRMSGVDVLAPRNVFCRIAYVYDLMNFLISFGLIRYWRKRAACYLALGAGEIGLDLGTGTADLAIASIQVSVPGARMIGVDMTQEMLDRGNRKVRQLGLQDRVALYRGDVEQLDLPDNSVDCCG